MFTYLYEWLKDISFYLILVTAVMHILPGKTYQKYIQFFTGLVLILLLIHPVMQFIGNTGYDFEKELRQIERMEEVDMINEIEKMREQSQIQIEVEEIVIGPEKNNQ